MTMNLLGSLLYEKMVNYVESGLLDSQKHPYHDNLFIFNYSKKCQYENLWNDITLNCRGLVIDSDTGDVVARPFPKFFNLSEHNTEDIPNLPFDVFDKMDGSLGILFFYNGEWNLATRGSFASEQAIKGKKMLDSLNLYNSLDEDFTYLFEIIYKENVIVCNYDFEDVVLLGAINKLTGEEMPYNELPNGFRIVKKYDGVKDYNMLKDTIPSDKEGYVIRFSNGFRVKIKGDEYVRLHRILTNVSNLTIWEYLKDSLDFDELIDRVPDEFYNSVKTVKCDLEGKFLVIEENAKKAYNETIEKIGEFNRAEFAKYAIANHKDLSPIMFSILDGKDYNETIWRIVKPNSTKLRF